jgi:nitrite reductase/ring-hydroxylating ferredoxin subunit
VNALAASVYSSPDVFATEQRSIFLETWQLAGFTSQLADDGEFVMAPIGDRSVVVRNFGGSLRAFTNVCAHRGARIAKAEHGNGPLLCPYHAWNYGRDGAPVGPPEAAASGARLERWRLETVGSLVLVKLRDDGRSLEESLGVQHETVARFANALGDHIATEVATLRANWKVRVEDALDDYRARVVRPSTFVVFPNVVLSSTGDLVVIERVGPLGPRESRSAVHVFAARCAPLLDRDLARRTVAALAGDASICERVQLGLEELEERAILGEGEQRIAAFQRAYREAMPEGSVGP